jgi:hypothetical protein
MKQASETLVPLDPYQLAVGFRRLATLTNDSELAERMMRHADEAEREASQPHKAGRR